MKIKDLSNPNRLALTESIVFDCAEAVRIAGILLQPYMPTKAGEILDMLGVKANRRTSDDAVYGVDHSYGTSTWTTTERGEYGTVFPPLVGEKDVMEERIRTKKGKVQRKEEKREQRAFVGMMREEGSRDD